MSSVQKRTEFEVIDREGRTVERHATYSQALTASLQRDVRETLFGSPEKKAVDSE